MAEKKKLAVFAALLAFIMVSLVLAGCSSSSKSDSAKQPAPQADVKPIALKYATYTSSNHYMGQLDKEYFEKVEKETNGRVKTALYFDSTLVKPTEWYKELTSGVADIAQASPGTAKDRFPLDTVTPYFTYGITDLKVFREIFTELYETTPAIQKEYREVVPLIRITAGECWVHTTKKPIRTIADFKGMTIKAADDPSFALLKSVGANPVRIPISETYTALEKGVIDGVLTGADPLKTFNFAEVTKYSTQLPYLSPWVVSKVVNKDSWAKLPPDIQKNFKDNAVWWETELISRLGKECQAGIDTAKKRGNEIIELPQAERDKIIAIMEGNAKKVATDLDAKGMNATEIFNKSRELVKKYGK